VRVRVYLSTNRTISTQDRKLGEDIDFGDFCFNCDWQGNITRSIPYSVPSGTYYVGLMISRNGSSHDSDSVPSNDTTWIPTQLTVTPGDIGWVRPGDLVPLPITLSQILAAESMIDTTGAGADPDPPYCGTTTMGPSIFLTFTAPETGIVEVGPSGRQGPSADLLPVPGWMVAAYEVSATGGMPSQPGAVACGDFVDSLAPLTMAVTAGKTYVLRFGSAGQGSISAPFGIRVIPSRAFGSAPELPMPYSAAITTSIANLPTAGFATPCTGGSTAPSRGFWHAWKAPADGTLVASTCRPATNFPNVVSIHARTAPMQTLACGATGSGGSRCSTQYGAQAQLHVSAGQEYLVRVGTLSTQSTGNFALDLKFAADTASNAGCGSLTALAAGSQAPFATVAGGVDAVRLCDGSLSTSRAEWFKYVATASGKFRASTCPDLGGQSSGESSVSIFGACPVAGTSAVALACDNDACDGVAMGASLVVASGQTVYVRVSGREGGAVPAPIYGKVAFTFEATCAGDLNGDRSVDGADLGALLSRWGMQVGTGTPDAIADLNADGTINGADLGVLLSRWGPC
jgi:hypothetical protein